MHPESSKGSSGDTLQILMVDDHPIYRAGFIKMLEGFMANPQISEASNAHDCLYKLARVAYDLLILDISMPDMDGLDCLKMIHKKWSALDVYVISPFEESHLIREARGLGVRGFFLKTSTPLEICEALRKSMAGAEFVTAPIHIRRAASDISLTRREMEVLRLLCVQLSSKEIAEELFLSKHTVDNHRKNILNKTSQKNTLALVNWAIQHKWVDLVFIEQFELRRKKS